MQQPEVWHLLTHLPQPEQPFITVINSEGRIELSGRTLVNGVSKAANALRDLLEAEPGESIDIDLGWTWQQSVWQGAALIAGLNLISQESDASHQNPDYFIDTNMISVHPLGLPTGAEQELTAEVLSQPDTWLYPQYWPQQSELLNKAREWATELGIHVGDRVGINPGRPPEQAFDYGLFLMPLAMEASVVIVDSPERQFESIVEQERITRLL
jgi:uncharacterized protein (TIGR03089 family)